MNSKKIVLKGIRNRKLKAKLGQKCVYCGCTNPLILTIDHKVPLFKGGPDTDANKQVACFVCNNLKDVLSHSEFKKYYKSLISMYELQKVSIFLAEPKVTFHGKGYPSTEAEILKAIAKEEESRNGN